MTKASMGVIQTPTILTRFGTDRFLSLSFSIDTECKIKACGWMIFYSSRNRVISDYVL